MARFVLLMAIMVMFMMSACEAQGSFSHIGCYFNSCKDAEVKPIKELFDEIMKAAEGNFDA